MRPIALLLAASLASCGARSGLAEPTADVTPADAPADLAPPDDAPPLGVSASFFVSTAPEGARLTSGSGVFWTGDRRPRPGGGGPSHRLAAGESVSINGVALAGGSADWGYTYQSGAVPVRADGRWEFRFVIRGQVITRTLVLQPVRWVGFPTAPVSIGPGVTLRWEPALPEATTRRAYLTSCVLNDRADIGVAAATFHGRLSATPCLAHAQLYATLEAPIGAPFRDGTISASTGLDRELRVVP